jgi:long-chain fatty acid transport protein
MKRSGLRTLMIVACLALVPASALAQGAMLHGIGPVNSSMGGAGTALPNESLGALMFNPALIAGAQGNQISFTTEFFKDSIRIETTLFDPDLTGVMVPKNKLGVLPAFGWMMRHPQKKLAIGFGLLGIAGFRTDYHQSDESILFAQPPNGFGRIFTDYRVTKVPVAFAYQVSPKLAVGASLNVYIGEFAVSPLPYKVFDLDANDNRFYPEAGSLASAYAVTPQFGFYYQHSSLMSIGGSLTLPQNFTKYEWNSTIANPGRPDYGRARTLDFDLDGPMIVSFGTAIKNAKTQLAIDGMFTKYTGVEGFGSPGGIVDGIVFPFGWRNVWTIKAGVQHQVTDTFVVRGGYNYSNMPLQDEKVLTMTGAPATFQHHYSGGVGIRMFPFLEAEAAFYFVPRDHVTGPFPNLANEVIGGIDESNKLTSALIGLNFRF